jgi:RsiW-degrading membrane proteinase PrsW (M82 family)
MTPSTEAPTIQILFNCISGPDAGKRFILNERELVVGRAVDCNVLSDDPDVSQHHAAFCLKGGKPVCRSVDSAAVYLDGQSVIETSIEPGQQLRMGRSFWQINSTSGGDTTWIGKIGQQITGFAAVEKIQGFSIATMFSDVFKKRASEEVEDYLIVGTRTTTPPLSSISADWPRPWLFFKAFTLSAAVYLLFYFGWTKFNNDNLIPGLIGVGSIGIPFSILIFFFEMNVVRNVSMYEVIKLLVLGGVLSLIVSLFAYDLTQATSWVGAGIIEETGKAAALFLVVRKLRYPWILNGMLFGAAVGTGFAVFESSGYALHYSLSGNTQATFDTQLMVDVITKRGVLSILGGHVLWSAMVGGALWRVRGNRDFSFDMLKDFRFLRVFAIAALLHAIWDSPLQLPWYGTELVLGFVAWVVLLGQIQQGLRQVKLEQAGASEAVKVMAAI